VGLLCGKAVPLVHDHDQGDEVASQNLPLKEGYDDQCVDHVPDFYCGCNWHFQVGVVVVRNAAVVVVVVVVADDTAVVVVVVVVVVADDDTVAAVVVGYLYLEGEGNGIYVLFFFEN
jgi:hypothetical protein